MRIIGYGVCGPGEADKYLEQTLKEFERLCDDAIILLCNATDKEKQLIDKYGFKTVVDDREWGRNQHLIKQDFVTNHVAKMNPDWCICMDMDERFDKNLTRERFEQLEALGNALYFYVVNLWDDGYAPTMCFWNIRAWKWDRELEHKVGDRFYQFEPKPLHCGLAPRWAYFAGSYAPHLLVHYGLKEKAVRDKKVERYETYDPDARHKGRQYYDSLKKDMGESYNEEKLYDAIMREVAKIKQKPKNVNLPKKDKVLFFRRKSDGQLLDVMESRADSMLKNPNFELVQDMEGDKEVTETGGFKV